PVHGIAPWRVATISPVHEPIVEIQFQIDGLWQTMKKELDVLAICRSLTSRNFQISPEDSALACVVVAFLRPIELCIVNIESDTHTPVSGVQSVGFATTGFHEDLDIRSIQIRTHDSHAFAVRPINLLVLLVDFQLLGCEGTAHRNDGFDMTAVEVSPFDG